MVSLLGVQAPCAWGLPARAAGEPGGEVYLIAAPRAGGVRSAAIQSPVVSSSESGHLSEAELYDLEADPYELDNLAGRVEMAPVVEELRKEMRRLVLESLGLGD